MAEKETIITNGISTYKTGPVHFRIPPCALAHMHASMRAGGRVCVHAWRAACLHVYARARTRGCVSDQGSECGTMCFVLYTRYGMSGHHSSQLCRGGIHVFEIEEMFVQHLGEDGSGDEAQEEAGHDVTQVVTPHQRP